MKTVLFYSTGALPWCSGVWCGVVQFYKTQYYGAMWFDSTMHITTVWYGFILQLHYLGVGKFNSTMHNTLVCTVD